MGGSGGKKAFVDPAGGMPPGGAPPMDPAMMGMPPGGAPPVDPSMQMMADQEMMRTIIHDEVQKALGGDAGQGAAPAKKGGNKVEEALTQMEQRIYQKIEQRDKVMVAVLRQAGIEIPLADVLGVESSTAESALSPSSGKPGISETLAPGGQGTNEGSSLAKVSEFDEDVQVLTKLADARKALNRSVFSRTIETFDPRLPEKTVFNGLYR